MYSVVDDQLYDWVENCEIENEDLRKQALAYTVIFSAYGLEQISKMGEETFKTNLEMISLYVDLLNDTNWKNTPDYNDHFGGTDKLQQTLLMLDS